MKKPKGQLISEWIYEVIASPKIQTKNCQDFCLTTQARVEILTIFCSYLERNDDFINSFWNCLTFRTTKINWRGKIAALFIINSRLDSTGGSRMYGGILRINTFGHMTLMTLDSEIKILYYFHFLCFHRKMLWI